MKRITASGLEAIRRILPVIEHQTAIEPSAEAAHHKTISEFRYHLGWKMLQGKYFFN